MPGLGFINRFVSVINEAQNTFHLVETLSGDLTIDKYSQLARPFIHTKTAPDNLASEIRTKANTEAVIMILDKAGVIKHITNKFYLESMQMSMREKVQIMETFGAANISFFGESARVYVFNARTVDAPSQDSGMSKGKYYYQSSILKMYNNVLRGSQLIKDDKIAVMKVANHIIHGYPLNLNIGYNASQDPVTQFTLQFVVAEHTLDLPGVVSEKYLEKMYSTAAHINNDAIAAFVDKIDDILEKINNILETNTGETGEGSQITEVAIRDIQNTPYNFLSSTYYDEKKPEYIALLTANILALQSFIGGSLDGDISPLVESKVPPAVLDRMVALIPNMFEDTETYNLVATGLRSLIQLKKELNIFKFYKINRGG